MSSNGSVERGQPPERRDRHRARAWALQVHYLWESRADGGTLRDALVETLATRRVSEARLPYVRRLLTELDAHPDEIDRTLVDALENWSLDRVSAVDRAILRIAVGEMLYLDDIPPKVSIQEAIVLAESYGGNDSPRFVNGVLDAVYKSLSG